MTNIIEEYFQKLDISFERFKHRPLHSVEESLGYYKEIGIPENKSLFLRDKKKKRYFLLIMSGEKRADLKNLAKIFNEPKLSFVSENGLREILNTLPGAVSPFGLIFDKIPRIEVFLDKSLTKSSFIGFHPNKNTETWKISQKNFQKFLQSLPHKVEIINI
jgi:Ala-tRNA(Pro) deacylase